VLDLSLVKIAVLMALAVMIFGPEKVPALIADAVRLLRNLQTFARTGTDELKQSLGPEFADLRPQDLHPKALVARALTSAAPELSGLTHEIRETVQPLQEQLRHGLDVEPHPAVSSPPPVASES
jgi:sec-independent protein translocase protein TatB